MHLLKIIHGYPTRYNAGSEVYSQSVCNALSQSIKVSVFSREENPFAPDFSIRTNHESDNLRKYMVNMARGKDGYRHQDLDAAFQDLLDEIRPSIAHIGHLNHLSTGLVDALRQRDIPIVFTLHDFWLMCPRGQFLQRTLGATGADCTLCDRQEDEKCASHCYNMYFGGHVGDQDEDLAYWTKWIGARMLETRRLAAEVDIFIAPSQYLRDRFVRSFGLPADKILYLDYGFPLHYLRTESRRTTTQFTFGYIGTHIPSKGVHHLIEAFGMLQGDALLRIWGRHRAQETDALKELAARNPDSNARIEWMGEYVNENIADKVFRHCDVIVVPSIWMENSPLVIPRGPSLSNTCDYRRPRRNERICASWREWIAVSPQKCARPVSPDAVGPGPSVRNGSIGTARLPAG